MRPSHFLLLQRDWFGLRNSRKAETSRYFLIGSLSSVLVVLCAGWALRYALLALWPDLLVLQSGS